MKKILCFVAMVIMISAFLPVHTTAATKKMTVYKEVLKDGNTVYCNTGIALYKVNIKNGKKKTLRDMKRGAEDYSYNNMKKKGKWLYFTESKSTSNILCRINISSKKYEKIMSKIAKWEGYDSEVACVSNYVISGSRIYCNGSYNTSGTFNKTMKLNGKGKKNVKVKIRMKEKSTNVKGYRVIINNFEEEGNTGYYSYLKTPKKTYYLGKSYD